MPALKIPRIPTIDDLDIRNSRVLVRVDFNSPIEPKTGEILNDFRIRSHVETLKELAVDRNCSVVVIAHQGRPGEKDFTTLEAHARKLSEYIGFDVEFLDDVMGPSAREKIRALEKGRILVLDNVRFVSEELLEAVPEKQAQTFLVRRLAPLFDYYVNDAFGTAHRSQPSIVGFPLVLPSAAGRLMEREVNALRKAFGEPSAPRVFVLGGGKVYDSLRIIEYLVRNKIADRILTTGLVAQLFLVAKAVNIGLVNKRFLEEKGILALVSRARRILLSGAPIETPIDFKTLSGDQVRNETVGSVQGLIMDIGEQTIQMYSELMKEANVIVVRGPAGVIEDPRFRNGTAKLLDSALETEAFVIIGGGHLAVLADPEKIRSRGNVHLSTGGGALLLFLAGEELPALYALNKSAKKFLGWKN